MGKVSFLSGLDEEARVNFMEMLRDFVTPLEKLLEVLSLLKTCKQAVFFLARFRRQHKFLCSDVTRLDFLCF